MGKTLSVAADREFDKTKTILPAEMARGVYMTNSPSVQALKLMHFLIGTAAGRMSDDVQHSATLSEIRKVSGMKNHDRSSLLPLFEELRAAVLTYDEPQKLKVTVGGLLDEAQVDYRDEAGGDTVVLWYFSRTFRRLAAESDHWAILDRQTVFHLSSKYSILLFQHVSSLIGLSHIRSKNFTIPELRAVLGIPADRVKRFADLNKDVLSPAIAEINQLSRLDLSTTLKKQGRSVVSVEIAWMPKKDITAAKKELSSAKVGRKERRLHGPSEALVGPSQGFPEAGSIRWTPWEALARLNAPAPIPDMELISQKFREFCAARGLSLSAGNIEKTFVAWVGKFRVG